MAAAKHAWRGYEAYAMGFDELMPMSGAGKNTFGGLGTTVVDSLDTLWVLGLKDEFKTARNWVAEKLDFDRFGSTLMPAPSKSKHSCRMVASSIKLTPWASAGTLMCQSLRR